MNAILPAGIESYLKEAGFSSTEMLVLRKLLEEESLTVRELASKTGKSTGVLDQAMKKLLGKRIAVKGTINGQPRYSIQSLDTIVRWVKQDMQERKQTLERRHQNFESFISSLKLDRTRPDIEHFSGIEGIQQAYLRLLESGQELLTIAPILFTLEEDPLRHFKVDLFRKRQVRKIFQRVLAPDTPLARRFQSRDPFEYRRTLLVPEADLPVTFEKIITDSIVACFNHENQTACFLKFPDLAKAERAAFEALWIRTLNPQNTAPAASNPVLTPIPLKTRLLSSFREFILGPRSIAVLVIFALLAATLTFGLYKSNRDLNFRRLQDKVTAIAATAALQFDSMDIEAIQQRTDIHKPQYAKLVAILNLIRRSNVDIRYAYLMRRTSEAERLRFIADADSLRPTEEKDLNADGHLDAADALSYPGDLYDTSNTPQMLVSFQKPSVDMNPTTDQWGTFISGYAPIKNDSGESIAIVGFDFLATELDRLSAESFSPLIVFIIVFLLFVIGRFFALNRSLLHECASCAAHNKRKVASWILLLGLLSGVGYYGYGQYRFHEMLDETGKRLMAIAITAADDFDPQDLGQLHFARDMKREAYQRVFHTLNEIRNKNPEISVAYLVRPTADPMQFEFIADSDANYNLPQYLNVHIEDTEFDEQSDESPWPGYIYEDFYPVFRLALKRPAYGYAPIDKWGSTLTGMAPIFSNGELVAILGLDVTYDKSQSYNH